MKKRFLALFTTLTLLTTFNINFVYAVSTVTPSNPTDISGNPITSGEITPSPSVSGEITPAPTVSGDTTPPTSDDTSGDLSGDTSGDISGEIITVTAYDENLKIDRNTILTATLRATSTITDSTLTYIIVGQPSHGTLVHTKETDNSFTYTPDLDYTGTDTFTFQVSDGTTISNIATVTIVISVPEEEIIPFYYVDMQTHWANYSASHLAARGIIIGEEIGNRYYFYPNREITRSDFMLYLLAITESNEDANIKIPDVTFADASTTPDWLIEAAKLAYAKGIIKGSADGNKLYLNPYKTLTRKEAVVMIDNILDLTDATDALKYVDATSIPDWATQAVKNLTAYKIIQGNSNNEFRPNKIISKAEAAEMCFKLIKQLESEEMPDTSGDIK